MSSMASMDGYEHGYVHASHLSDSQIYYKWGLIYLVSYYIGDGDKIF